MPEYVERGALLEKLQERDLCLCVSEADIKELPAANVAPVVHGHVVTKNRPTSYDALHFIGTRENSEPIYTIERKELEDNPVDYCSVCGRRLCSRFTNYCPNCGATMDKDADDAQ